VPEKDCRLEKILRGGPHGQIFNQTMAELKQLPLLLGKLAGGIVTVAGFSAAMIKTGNPGRSFHISGSISLLVLPGVLFYPVGKIHQKTMAPAFQRFGHRHERSLLGIASADSRYFSMMYLFFLPHEDGNGITIHPYSL
jgi:hypothetical protein